MKWARARSMARMAVCAAESLFDPYAVPEGQGVGLVPRGASVDC